MSNVRWAILTVGAFLGVTVIMGGLLWAMGLFNFSGTDSAAKVLVAVLALVGTLFGTMVTLIGLMLKRSMDARTLVLQTEAEARLNLDTAIKAVELFKSASGSASSAESAGALFALTRLGQAHFALALLEELWPKSQIGSPSAVWVINSCLQSKDLDSGYRAAVALQGNVARLPDGAGGKSWPADYELEWPNEISFLARYAVLQARIECMVSKPFDYWDANVINADVVALTNCFRTDASPILKQSAAAFLAVLLESYDPRHGGILLYLPTGNLAVEEVRAEIEKSYGSSFLASSHRDQTLTEELRQWVKRSSYYDVPPPMPDNSGGA
jgi:hypothetical protein